MKLFFKFLPLVLTAFLLLNFSATKAEKVLRPKLKDIHLWSDEKFLTHNVKLDANDPHLNITLNILQQLHNVDLHIEAFLVQKPDAEHFFTLNTTLNLCDALYYSTKSPVGALLASYLKYYGRILEKCPINKGNYNLQKFWIPEDTTLSHFAEMDFNISFKAIHVDASKQKTVIINDQFSGELLVHDAKNVRTGILALLPKMH